MFEIGASLREARARRGLSAEDVQKAIRIRDRYLHALEDERWELLPGDAYVKGFLRTYAEYLGLNGNLYVDEYNSRFASHDDPAFVPEAAEAVETVRIGVLRPLFAIVAIVTIVAAVAAWQLRGSSQTPPVTNPHASPATPTTTGSTPPAHTKTTTETTAQQAPAAAALPTSAVLAATRGRVWLQVRSGGASGPVLFEGVLEQGKTLPVKLSPKVWFRVGAPWNLDVRMGGRAVSGLPAQPGNVVLSPTGLAPAG